MDRTGDPSDLSLLVAQLGADLRYLAASDEQAHQVPVDVAAMRDPNHRLLADIAPLREAGGPLQAGLLKEIGLVHIDAIPMDPGLDPHGVERLHSNRTETVVAARLQERLPHRHGRAGFSC